MHFSTVRAKEPLVPTLLAQHFLTVVPPGTFPPTGTPVNSHLYPMGNILGSPRLDLSKRTKTTTTKKNLTDGTEVGFACILYNQLLHFSPLETISTENS